MASLYECCKAIRLNPSHQEGQQDILPILGAFHRVGCAFFIQNIKKNVHLLINSLHSTHLSQRILSLPIFSNQHTFLSIFYTPKVLISIYVFHTGHSHHYFPSAPVQITLNYVEYYCRIYIVCESMEFPGFEYREMRFSIVK